MKRLIGFVVMLMAVAGVMGLAYGGDKDTINIRVTLATDIQVDITQTEYQFGTLNGGQTSVSGSAATVTNTSSSNREDWKLNLTNPGGSSWTAIQDGVPGENQYMLMAQFGTAAGSWTSANQALSVTATDCSVNKFGNGTYDECGLDVSTSGTRSLWFRITMPSYSTETSERTIPVTVTAVVG